MLSEFSQKQNIPYPLLSDLDSAVIRDYQVLNTRIDAGDAFLEGIPFPGVFVADEDGVVIAKFFHDTYKKRDSPELLIDAALGRIELADDAPSVVGGDDEVRVTAAIHGGKGTIRQGIIRQLVVRFELAEGFHIYGNPVPEGMIPAQVEINAPPGLVIQPAILPPTTPLRLESMGLELPVWSGQVDFVYPFYALGELASETRPLDHDKVKLEVTIRYQACDDQVCLLPKTEKLTLDVALDVIDIPQISVHQGHGQRAANYNGMPHVIRLLLRKVKKNPLGFVSFMFKMVKIELAARRRARQSK